MSDLQIIADHLQTACCPEDVFGNVDAASVVGVYRKLARSVHPDFHPTEKTKADKAFQRLNFLRQEADNRIANGEWGKRIPLKECLPLRINSFEVERNPIIGDIADIYRVKGRDSIIKIARNSDDNDLMRAEVEALKTVKAKIKTIVADGIPVVEETFQIDGLRKRQANVLTVFNGFVTCEEAHRRLPTFDSRTLVWLFKRLLVLIEWVHHAHLIHGAIIPPHVMVFPDNAGSVTRDPRKHTIRLIDWCYAVNCEKRTRLSGWVPKWKDHYAPEVIAKEPLGPWTDIYMAGMLIQYLSNGPLPKRLQGIVNRCVQSKVSERYHDAGEVFRNWTEAAAAEFGKPQWHQFVLPT